MSSKTSKTTKAERRKAADLASQRYAMAHDSKARAAELLARIQADPDSTAADITEATEELSKATALYREAQAAANQVPGGRW
ncbi:hypothetical protein ACIBPB_19920 [Micromonospora sp. NPDC049836]|uniref:hypothetical protein n=1 Tax=Micromonospora sp. NPDC049836 TaxID=3364274 RepID=UPI0037A79859